MDRRLFTITVGLVTIAVALLLGSVLIGPALRDAGRVGSGGPRIGASDAGGIVAFSSDAEFREYFSTGRDLDSYGGFGMGAERLGITTVMAPEVSGEAGATAKDAAGIGGGAGTARYSETNVQIAGIDEPDIVKTDGENIYVSRENGYRILDGPAPMMIEGDAAVSSKMIAPYPYPYAPDSETGIFSAYPPEKLGRIGSVARGGEILLFDNILVVFPVSRQEIIGYDIAAPDEPKELWRMSLARDGTGLLQARQYQDRLYLVLRTWVDELGGCPVVPFTIGERRFDVACTDIYHPSVPAPADSVYTAVAIDPRDGDRINDVSFAGSTGDTVVFMSPESIYVTFPALPDPVVSVLGFASENRDLFPAETIGRLERLLSYELGPAAKVSEIGRIMDSLLRRGTPDDRLRMENELFNRMEEYQGRHLRDGESTSIARVAVKDMRLTAAGTVPGRPLNQFSLDEYDGYLRIATTVGGNGGLSPYFSWSGVAQSENDVTILDDDLETVGSVTGLGVDERIYATRFIGDRGYVVTFRETDPFYVLDLSDPKRPRKAGELKIPGYSSYLHPLADGLVLGIGQEDGRVKLSVFDVSDPDRPLEVSKYALDEYWSEALGNHRAFLADERHGTFFLPGGQGGYVFSYRDGKLALEKAVRENGIRRAVYIGDVLYVISDSAIRAFDERTWEEVGSVDFE